MRQSITMLATILLTSACATVPPAEVAQGPLATFDEVAYQARDLPPPPPAGMFRNPVMPGFNPDPSVVRVGKDFYLVTSTFAWFPGLPVYHSTDLVNWTQIANAVDRPGLFDFSGLTTTSALFAPTISYHDGVYRIFNTCIRCRGNFMLEASDPAGPWSDPIWLDFPGIDPSLFVDEDGRAYVVHNGDPAGPKRYDGHTAIWIHEIDLKARKMIGEGKVLVDGGVNPAENPIWIEGPHLFKHDGWYYLSPAEGGTEINHAQTIFRSRNVDGPYVPGPVNPILTQRDLSPDRPDRIEDTGHADMVQLADGSWWGVFLATRPFTKKSTMLGRETFLLPVTWKDGWPLYLEKGEPVPIVLPKPDLPASPAVDRTQWRETFDRPLGMEWLRLRTPTGTKHYRLANGQLVMTPSADAAGSMGDLSFTGRRLQHPTADVSTVVNFDPGKAGDFAGLAAFVDDNHFLAFGVEGAADGSKLLTARLRKSADESDRGVVVAQAALDRDGPVELKVAIDEGTARVAWRVPGSGTWRDVGAPISIEPIAVIHAGLFTGMVVGPYAVRGE